jgi:hypothetical protein
LRGEAKQLQELLQSLRLSQLEHMSMLMIDFVESGRVRFRFPTVFAAIEATVRSTTNECQH